MERKDQVGVATIAAAAGALAGLVASRPGAELLRRAGGTRPVLELLPRNGPDPGDVLPVRIPRVEDPPPTPPLDETDPAAGADDAEGADPAGARRARVRTTGARTAGRSRTAAVAAAVSNMAIGALVTLLVLWLTGTSVGGAGGGTEVLFEPPADAVRAAGPPAAGGADAVPPPDADAEAGPDDPVAGGVAEDAPAAAIQRVAPVQVDIPAIGVRAPVIALGTDRTGALEVPEDFAEAGWWTGGPEPGEIGPSVIVGHVDSFEGPAVFFSLDQLAYDDVVEVTRADGSTAVFAVRSMLRVDKSTFPTDLVYGQTDGAELRLITCDGDFSDGSYLGNLIVTAELVREDVPPTSGTVF